MRDSSLQHNPPKPVLEHGRIEIYQETGANSAQLHLGQHLRLVYRHQTLDCFELEDDLILNDDVETTPAV